MATAIAPTQALTDGQRNLLRDIFYIAPFFDRRYRAAEKDALKKSLRGDMPIDIISPVSHLSADIAVAAIAMAQSMDEVFLATLTESAWWDEPGVKDTFRRLFTESGIADHFDVDGHP